MLILYASDVTPEKVKRFEDLIAWQKARVLNLIVYHITRRGKFHQALATAKAACAEVRSLLYVAFDAGYLDKTSFEKMIAQAEELGRVIGSLRASIQRQRTQPRMP